LAEPKEKEERSSSSFFLSWVSVVGGRQNEAGGKDVMSEER
jgi:hypothetical protein